VGDDSREERVRFGCLCIGVGVEGVASFLGEFADLFKVHYAQIRGEAIAYLQLGQRLAERVRVLLLAAKRYRSRDHLQFSRSQAYSDGRSARRSRDNRAISNNSAYGRDIAALQWANAEWTYLLRCYEAGISVPYPVQIDGTEILMEFIADPDNSLAAAPRLQQLARFDPRLPALWDQLTDALEKFAGLGIAHGDLSAYNLLVSGERLVVIDVPQCVDLAGNPQGMDFLHRDCVNLCEWFDSKGLSHDPDELFASLLGHLF
jgi:RIO kinase 1